MSESAYLFVYGTLMARFAHPMHRHLRRHAEFVAEASMAGKLYRVAHYPGVVPSASALHRVFGELYRVLDPHALFTLLDDYEECGPRHPKPHEYRRSVCPVLTGAGNSLDAWVYVYQAPIAGLQRIPSGRFC